MSDPFVSPSQRQIRTTLLLVLLILSALWFRMPRLGEGMPFFYQEDEAHHFNRVVNMVKTGDLNPHYFHKPSLHFYVRIPFVAAGFLWNVRAGSIRSIQDVVTKDTYGVGDYAFSVSHSGMVKWVRLPSLLMSVGLVLLTYFFIAEFTLSLAPRIIGAALVAVSPALIEDSAVVGVDILMSFMVLVSTYIGIRASKQFSLSRLWWCAFFAGLALSSKYNALPIVIVPLLVCLFTSRTSWQAWTIALGGPVLGFLIGSPYVVSSLPLFLDQMAYEVWHYGIAAHEGHNAEPGLAQALFYLKWLNFEALGPVATTFGILGMVIILKRHLTQKIVFLSFPILFAALMISQRTNFTRNMLVIIPFVAIVAALAAEKILDILRIKGKTAQLIYFAFFMIGVGYPAIVSSRDRAEMVDFVDTRSKATEELTPQLLADKNDTAVAGQLQFPPSLIALPGVSQFDQSQQSPLQLYQSGFHRFILSRSVEVPDAQARLLEKEKSFVGIDVAQRIVRSPSIDIVHFTENELFSQLLQNEVTKNNRYHVPVELKAKDSLASCKGNEKNGNEDYCWLKYRKQLVTFTDIDSSFTTQSDSSKVTLFIEIMSPWPNQKVKFSLPGWESYSDLVPGEWTKLTLQPPLSALRQAGGIFVDVSEVHSPSSRLQTQDARRLGVAVRRLSNAPF